MSSSKKTAKLSLMLFALGFVLWGCGKGSPQSTSQSTSKSTSSQAVHPSSDSSSEQQQLEQTEVLPPTNASNIGIMLPLTGKAANFGKFFKDQFKLSQKIHTKSRRNQFNLIFKDSNGDASAAFDQLIEGDQVIAVIYPIVESAVAKQIADRAHYWKTSILMLELPHLRQFDHSSEYVFKHGLSLDEQMNALVEFLVKEENVSLPKLKKFAMMHSDAPYGKYSREAFAAAINAYGKKLIAIEQYKLGSTSFNKHTKALAGTSNPRARADFKAKLKECEKNFTGDEFRIRKCTGKVEEGLSAVINFDALLVADDGAAARLIAPSIASADIITTRNKQELAVIRNILNKPIKPVILLGTDMWNDNQLLKHGREEARPLNGAVFVTGYFSGDHRSEAKEFSKHFKPSSITTTIHAIIYDSLLIFGEVARATRATTRTEFLSGLTQLKDFDVVLGNIELFNEQRRTQKQSHFLTVYDGQLMRYQDVYEKR